MHGRALRRRARRRAARSRRGRRVRGRGRARRRRARDGRKPAGVRDLLELPRPAPSAPWAYVKVAEGCDRACAFCAIPSFRGKQRSRAAGVDRSRGARARRAGRRRDRARRAGPRLVRTRRRRARFARAAAAPARRAARATGSRASGCSTSIRPRSRTRSSRRCSSCRPVVPYFDLSLQHARARSVAQHEAMGERRALPRDASTASAREEPDAAFRSSFIVGFPGETESDHETLLAFLADARLDWAGFFAFSREDGTAAATMDGAVADVARARAAARVCRGAGADHRRGARRARRRDDRRAGRRRRRRRRARRPHAPRGARDRRRRAARVDGRRRVRPARARSCAATVCGVDGPDLEAEGRRRDAWSCGGAATARRADARSGSDRARSRRRRTSSRSRASLVAIPTLALIRRDGSAWATVGLWFAITATDSLDGWLARRDGATRSGAFLDPVADKLIVLGGLAVLADRGVFPWWPVAADRGARVRHLAVPVDRGPARHRAARAAARQVQGVHAVLLGRVRAAADHRRLGRASSRSCSASRWCSRVVSGLQIVRRGYIDWQRQDANVERIEVVSAGHRQPAARSEPRRRGDARARRQPHVAVRRGPRRVHAAWRPPGRCRSCSTRCS